MDVVRWGIIGCGDVTEVKSGPGFQKARGSALVAVMRRDRALAEDYARRHEVPRVHATADDLIHDPGVDAVYIATPPSSHAELACRVAEARKPCLVEKPMAASFAECTRMIEAFRRASTPLWVAYYRRALPRFLRVRDVLRDGSLGAITSVQVELRQPFVRSDGTIPWRFSRAVAGGGLFYDMGSHAVDLLDFLLGPAEHVAGISVNTAGVYEVDDVTAAMFRFGGGVLGTGVWNFNSGAPSDTLVVTAARGEVRTSVFGDADVIVTRDGQHEVHEIRNPPHVHQPLIQTIVDELAGRGACESTAASGGRASLILEMCSGSHPVTRVTGARADPS